MIFLIVSLRFDGCNVFSFAVTGTLKGYDQLLNLVLDEAVEFVRGIPYVAISFLCIFKLFFTAISTASILLGCFFFLIYDHYTT